MAGIPEAKASGYLTFIKVLRIEWIAYRHFPVYIATPLRVRIR